jgi:hypothetical protein
MGRFWADLRLLLYTQISQCFTPKPAAVPGNVIETHEHTGDFKEP